MRQDAVLSRLRPLEGMLRRQGIAALFLFGSAARDSATEASDIDLAFDIGTGTRFSLFDQARIGNDLAEALDIGVDFVPLEGLRPQLRDRIEAEMVRIF